jgi:hypothetical protein
MFRPFETIVGDVKSTQPDLMPFIYERITGVKARSSYAPEYCTRDDGMLAEAPV